MRMGGVVLKGDVVTGVVEGCLIGEVVEGFFEYVL